MHSKALVAVLWAAGAVFASSAWAEEAAPSTIAELNLRRAEPALLHRQVDLSDLMAFKSGSSGSSNAQFTWSRAPQDLKAGPIWVVHLWAVECGPCIAELPLLRNIVQGIQSGPLARDVRFAFITETYDDLKLARFLSSHRTDLPPLPVLRSPETDRRLRGALQIETQPVTLLLDRSGTVRHAMVGSFAERRSELAGAISRLKAVSK